MIGATFCQVARIKQFNQDNCSMVFGNQKWQGAAPSLINKEEVSKKLNNRCEVFDHWIILEYKRIADPRAWAKK